MSLAAGRVASRCHAGVDLLHCLLPVTWRNMSKLYKILQNIRTGHGPTIATAATVAVVGLVAILLWLSGQTLGEALESAIRYVGGLQ